MGFTDEEYREHTADLGERLQELRSRNVDSRILFGHLERGWVRWSPERRAQQRHVVSQIWDEDATGVPRAGQGFIMVGNDSGAMVEALAGPEPPVDADEYLVVDPYRIDQALAARNMIPHDEGFSPMEFSALVREESCQLAERLAHRAYSERCNVMRVQMFPGTPAEPVDPGADTIRSIVERFKN